MYSGYTATTLALRAKPAFCHSYLPLLGGEYSSVPGDADVALLHRFFIHPRFLLYGHYLRLSSLIYLAPSRPFISGHAGARYCRLASDPFPPKRSVRRGDSWACYQCPSSDCSLQEVTGLFTEVRDCCGESFSARSSRFQPDCDEFGYSRRNSRREVVIRPSETEKEQSLCTRRDGSSSICRSCSSKFCRSCGSKMKESGDKSDYDRRKRVNAAAFREIREVSESEDDISFDSRKRGERVRASNSTRVSGKMIRDEETRFIASDHRARENYDSEDEDMIDLSDGREILRKSERISEVYLDDRERASSSKNMAASRKMDREKGSTSSVKWHTEVQKQIVGQNEREGHKRKDDAARIWSRQNILDSRKINKSESSSPTLMCYSEVDDLVNGASESRKSSQKLREIKEVHDGNSQIASHTQKHYEETRLKGMKDTSTLVQIATDRRNHLNQQVVSSAESNKELIEMNKQYEFDSDASRSNVNNTEIASSSQMVSQTQHYEEARLKNRKDTSTSVQIATDMRNHVNQKAVCSTEFYDSNSQIATHAEKYNEEARLKDRKDTSTSVQISTDMRNQVNQHVFNKELLDVNKQYEIQSNASSANLRGTEITSSSQSLVETRIDDREDYSTSAVSLIHEAKEQQNQTDRRSTQLSSSRSETERYKQASEQLVRDTERLSSSQVKYLTTVRTKLNEHQNSSRRESEKDALRSDYSRVDLKSDYNFQEISTTKTQNHKESSSLVLVQEKERQNTFSRPSSQLEEADMAFSGVLDTGSSSVIGHIHDSNDHISIYQPSQAREDLLESASQLDKSSEMFVGEFVNKLQQEASSSQNYSEIQQEDAHSGSNEATTAVMLSPLGGCECSVQDGTQRSSSMHLMKGPSDEMWEASNVVSPETSRREELEENISATGVADTTTATPTTATAITQRSPKSLWAYIADIIRLGWASRTGSHASTQKSGKRISSSESIGSEAWFSGQELDASDDEPDKKRKISTSEDSLLVKEPTHKRKHMIHSTPIHGSPEALKIVEGVIQSEGGTSTSTDISKRGSVSLAGAFNPMGMVMGGPVSLNGASISTGMIETGPLSMSGTSTSLGLTKGDSVSMEAASTSMGMAKGHLLYPGANSTSVGVTRGGSVSVGGTSTSIGMTMGGSVSMGGTYASMNMKMGDSVSMDGTSTTGSGSGFISRPEDVMEIDADRGTKRTPSIVITVDQLSITGNAASATIEEGSIIGTKSVSVPVSDFTKLEEKLIKEEPFEVQNTEGKDEELKRRKFQRHNQVLKEAFDDWEEAFRLESEQKKIDEIFMREALSEAQKAGDMWEVPVGAVLVQNGKIIARGCNLVEDLRDSTAHAEMICIREASNLLRSWRLAGTTLYVTLEPCPMCAGAILQARIDTVVWGAANKLLGADGSWVRLFPGGDGGGSSLDPSNQLAGPVHPFHQKITIRRGILSTECSEAMQQFFKLRRKKNNKPETPQQQNSLLSHHPLKFFSKIHNIFSVMFCL